MKVETKTDLGYLYKIRDAKTGLYSMGGQYSPSWSTRGKVWKRLSAIKLHLLQLRDPIPDSWEVIAYETHIVEIQPALDVGLEAIEKRDARAQKRKADHEDWKRAQRRAEFEKLRKEFET